MPCDVCVRARVYETVYLSVYLYVPVSMLPVFL